MTPKPSRRPLAGAALVMLQFAFMAGLAWLAGPGFLGLSAPGPAWVALAASVAVGMWALQANRPGNFNIRPTPRQGGTLIAHGPYRWIRHPMYTSVGAFGVACALAAGSAAAAAMAAMLCGVLLGKALLEERWMAEQHPGYAAYIAGTRRFLPGIF